MVEGGQGERKSSALRILALEAWFTDDVTNIGHRGMQREPARRLDCRA